MDKNSDKLQLPNSAQVRVEYDKNEFELGDIVQNFTDK